MLRAVLANVVAPKKRENGFQLCLNFEGKVFFQEIKWTGQLQVNRKTYSMKY